MRSSEHHSAKKKLNKVLRQRILTTCGDAHCTQGHKHVDPALLLFVGCKVIFTGDNSHLEDLVSRGNGTVCEVVNVKLKDTANIVVKKYYNRKARTALADQVQYLELKKVHDTSELLTIKNDIHDMQNKLNTAGDDVPQRKNMEMKLNKLKCELQKYERLKVFTVEPEKNQRLLKCIHQALERHKLHLLL